MTYYLENITERRYKEYKCVECGIKSEHMYWLIQHNRRIGIFHNECYLKNSNEIELKKKIWTKRMNQQHITDDILFDTIDDLNHKLQEEQSKTKCEQDKNKELIEENKFLKELTKKFLV